MLWRSMINLRVDNVLEIKNWYLDFVWLEFDRYEYSGKKETPWNMIDNWAWDNLNMGFDDVLSANHSTLSALVLIMDNNLNKEFPYFIEDIATTYDHFSNKNKGIGCKESDLRIRAYDLLEHTGRAFCPYCNKVEIDNIHDGKHRCAELDHFFNKDDYPILALSFYNMIPCCHTCNNRKGKKQLGISPYENRNVSNFSEFYYCGDIAVKDTLSIEYKTNDEMILNESVLKIKSNYEKNIDELVKLLKRMSDTPKSTLEQLYKDSEMGYNSFMEVIETHFDLAWHDELLFKKHISKFKKDIIKKYYKLV